MKTALLSIALVTGAVVPAFAEDTVKQTSIGTALAVELAQSTVAVCSAQGYNVSATVVDRSGTPLALVRSENAGTHTAQASISKAFTSASSKNPTSGIADTVKNNQGAAGMVDIPGFLVLAGGVPLKIEKDTIGAIGVAGAPGGNLDEACAKTAIEKFAGRLK